MKALNCIDMHLVTRRSLCIGFFNTVCDLQDDGHNYSGERLYVFVPCDAPGTPFLHSEERICIGRRYHRQIPLQVFDIVVMEGGTRQENLVVILRDKPITVKFSQRKTLIAASGFTY